MVCYYRAASTAEYAATVLQVLRRVCCYGVGRTGIRRWRRAGRSSGRLPRVIAAQARCPVLTWQLPATHSLCGCGTDGVYAATPCVVLKGAMLLRRYDDAHGGARAAARPRYRGLTLCPVSCFQGSPYTLCRSFTLCPLPFSQGSPFTLSRSLSVHPLAFIERSPFPVPRAATLSNFSTLHPFATLHPLRLLEGSPSSSLAPHSSPRPLSFPL
eukprot:3940963-Rhodomonas_salina.1